MLFRYTYSAKTNRTNLNDQTRNKGTKTIHNHPIFAPQRETRPKPNQSRGPTATIYGPVLKFARLLFTPTRGHNIRASFVLTPARWSKCSGNGCLGNPRIQPTSALSWPICGRLQFPMNPIINVSLIFLGSDCARTADTRFILAMARPWSKSTGRWLFVY